MGWENSVPFSRGTLFLPICPEAGKKQISLENHPVLPGDVSYVGVFF